MSLSGFSPSHSLPNLTLEDLRADLAEQSLADFVRIGWRSFEKADYIGNWHVDAICEHLEAVSRGEIKRLIINIPPRHMKSTGVCVAWPAWTWLQQPTEEQLKTTWLGPSTQFLYSSYSQTLSTRDSVKCRRLLNSRWYRKHYADRFTLRADSNLKTRFDNDHLGYRIATSVDAMTTGEGGDICVIDDPHNVRQAESDAVRQGVLNWFDESFSNRLNDPKRGAFVLICQRVKENDLTGHILATQEAAGDEWVHLCLPARYEHDHPQVWAYDPRKTDGELLWPARIDGATLDALEGRMGSYAVAGQMQQRPAPREGGMFKREWFAEKMIDASDLPKNIVWWRHWDLAATKRKATDTRGARTAGVLMGRSGGGQYYVRHCVAKAVDGNAVRVLIKTYAETDTRAVNISLPQDPGQAGKVQKGDFAAQLAGWNVRITGEIGDKEQRAEPFAAQCEAGNVYIVVGDWNSEFLDELCIFPGGARKDIPDACSGAFMRLVPKQGDDEGIVGPRVYQREDEVDEYE